MPESQNQASSQQRRANWVALRTLRQLPKAVGETSGGEPVYEVRSIRLVLDSPATHFVRLSECSRCGRELTGAPVLNQADLDRPLRPMMCPECTDSAGVPAGPEPEGGEPASQPSAPSHSDPGSARREAGAERLDAMEGHLRAVTDRVNELGRIARAHQRDIKEVAQRDEATAAALRDELAADRASTDDTRSELQRVVSGQAELERRWPDGAGAGLVALREDVAQLARIVEAQREEVVGFLADAGNAQIASTQLAGAQEALAETLARFDPAELEGMVATSLAEAEGRLAHQIASQWGDLETAIEGSVRAHTAGVLRANEELAGGKAVLEQRIDALVDQVTEACRRMEVLHERLAALEAAAGRAPSSPEGAPAGGFLDSLDRQLEAAARRLAVRSQSGAGRGEP